MLNNLERIKIEKPVDKIIEQLRSLIISGDLKPGDKLPPERKLAERMGVGRLQVRDAIRKLEFYGIVKTLPQSGTIVAGLGISALEGLITDVLKIEQSDFKSLVETRVILEKQSAYFAALRRTDEDIVEMSNALEAYQANINSGMNAVEEDLLFHLKIAEASKNSVLKSLMMIITPDIVNSFISLEVCDDRNIEKPLDEHRRILQCIINQDAEAAADAMQEHLQDVLDYSNQVDLTKSKK